MAPLSVRENAALDGSHSRRPHRTENVILVVHFREKYWELRKQRRSFKTFFEISSLTWTADHNHGPSAVVSWGSLDQEIWGGLR